MDNITVATINIASASKERAQNLVEKWLIPSSCDVYVLTETSDGPGTHFITSAFVTAGWAVFQRAGQDQDRGVAIATRIAAHDSGRYPGNDPAPGRALVIELQTEPRIEIIGMYVPNRGNDVTKVDRKRAFLECWLRHLVTGQSYERHPVLIGDLNVVPREQHPEFLPQMDFEYRWLARLETEANLYDAARRHGSGPEPTWKAYTGEGYTYDHIMPSKTLAERVTQFRYDHATRGALSVTDHSALVVTIQVDGVQFLHRNRLGLLRQAQLF